ncbi:hypothetical protein DSO57_1018432 [Entomophthora muscae]|uniref:Uncharacterized protein n=1 Tax=Entomophthora muscae TaxID=34485 RepID=A0ACC2UDN2_9FUNG|nr:hypothetical protein DSO57_1018432 [Entomophthora muscae]
MAEEGIIKGIFLLLSHKGKGSNAIENVLGFFSAFGVDQLMKVRALLEEVEECLPEVEVASLRGAVEDSYEGICLSLFKIHYQIFVIGKAFLSGLTIHYPRKSGPKGGIQTLNLHSCGPLGPWTKGLSAWVFFGIEPLQAEAPTKSQSQNICTSSTMVAPKEEPLKLPNGSRDGASVNFMSLKSSQVTNQTLLAKINPGFGPNPVTTAKNQEN